MKVLIDGHRYEVENFEGTTPQVIQFIHKEPKLEEMRVPGEFVTLVTIQDGTTNEELLNVLIDRLQYLQRQFPCRENAIVITKLEESLMWLEKRTRDRVARKVEGKNLQ